MVASRPHFAMLQRNSLPAYAHFARASSVAGASRPAGAGVKRSSSSVDTEPLERGFDLRQYLNFVWRNWNSLSPAFVFLLDAINLARNPALHCDNPSPARAPREGSRHDAAVNDRGLDDCSYLDNQLAILSPSRCFEGWSSRSGLRHRIQRNCKPRRKTKTTPRRRKEPS